MLKELPMYTVVCDCCGKDSNRDSEYAGWQDKGIARDVAVDSDWLTNHGDKDYCPACYEYDNDDNPIIKHQPK